jgi:hypothetical protein
MFYKFRLKYIWCVPAGGHVRCGVDGVSKVRTSACGVAGLGVICGMGSCRAAPIIEYVGVGTSANKHWPNTDQNGSKLWIHKLQPQQEGMQSANSKNSKQSHFYWAIYVKKPVRQILVIIRAVASSYSPQQRPLQRRWKKPQRWQRQP